MESSFTLFICMYSACFDRRTHTKGRLAGALGVDFDKMFQSTHPHRVRHPIRTYYARIPSFNPRTHIGCDANAPNCVTPQACFNPRTHTGCDATIWRCRQNGAVSIHAPTQGATNTRGGGSAGQEVSIHAPTQGATPKSRASTTASKCFNPRTHTGCDAPCSTPRAWVSGFNPRTHTGCDDETGESLIVVVVSIHAPTQGATYL